MTTDTTALQERIEAALIRATDDGADGTEDYAAAVLPIIAAEVQASKAEAILMDGFDMAVADHLADAGYTEYAEDEDGGVTWVSAPLGEVLHIVRISATEYETGDRA